MLSQDQKQLLLKQKQVAVLSQREERYTYLGILNEYQIIANKDLYQKLNYTKLNPQQHFRFKRVLHGLNMYTKDEVAKMHWDKKRRIIKVWKKGQSVINEWKQEVCNKKINHYLTNWFGKSQLVKDIIDIPATETLPDYNNKLKLKDLGITYEDLILKFMSVGLLPNNFLELK